jgi:diadenosine tetraphosphatase ApaH/serine/threonine PP2A family protein phosphatase
LICSCPFSSTTAILQSPNTSFGVTTSTEATIHAKLCSSSIPSSSYIRVTCISCASTTSLWRWPSPAGSVASARLAYLARSTIASYSFDLLPIAARFSGNYCVHGGISPQLQNEAVISSIEKLRQTENFAQSPTCDMLWSDPSVMISEFDKGPRGYGVRFGHEAVRRFLSNCKAANRIICSHESCTTGFNWPLNEGGPVLTVFSSCDYCDMMNDAAVTDHDGAPSCATHAPLTANQLVKRRVTFPCR